MSDIGTEEDQNKIQPVLSSRYRSKLIIKVNRTKTTGK